MSKKELTQEEIMKKEAAKAAKEEQNALDKEIAQTFDAEDIGVISKDMKNLLKTHVMGRDEMRFLVDTFYQLQEKRIACQGQIRSIEQNADESPDQTHQILSWYFDNMMTMEKSVLKLLDTATDLNPNGVWMKQTMGIGPALSAGFLSMLDITKASSAGHFMSYAGLNDNKCPRIGHDKAAKIINSAVDAGGLTEETLCNVFQQYGRSWDRMAMKCYTKDKKTKEPKLYKDGYHLSKEEAIKALCIIPYNSQLKVICWKAGQQFLKLTTNPKSKYGKIMVERKDYEVRRNESGENAELAKRILLEKNFNKSTDAYAALSQGLLPKAQIQARSERYAVKMFVSHLWECMYIGEHHITDWHDLPEPYAMKYLGHVDYVSPEVPYSSVYPFYKDRPSL